MAGPLPNWLRWTSRAALLLGLGALSATGARADASHESSSDLASRSQTERMSVGDVVVRSEAGGLYLSEKNGQPEELRLGDTPEARRLRQLLRQHGTESGVRLDRMLLAGGGGKGISWSHWKPVGPARSDNGAKASNSDRSMRPRDNAGGTRRDGASDSANLARPEPRK